MASKEKQKPEYSGRQLLRIGNGYCPKCPGLSEMKATDEDAPGGPTQHCKKCNTTIHGMPCIKRGD